MDCPRRLVGVNDLLREEDQGCDVFADEMSVGAAEVTGEVPAFEHFRSEWVLDEFFVLLLEADGTGGDGEFAVHGAEHGGADAEEEKVGGAVEMVNVLFDFVLDRGEIVGG